ncbi:MAG: hypothetical protein KKF44_00850, partial [Nanoarchaeota archaeon]|nr:hypothetical protein [Nanoarchaeota archaeon]
MRQSNKRLLIGLLILGILVLSATTVLAQSLPRVLENTSQALYNYMRNLYVKFIVTFILFFTLLYGMFGMALAKIKGFGDEGKLNKFGKIVAVSMSGLAVFGIFGLNRTYSLEALLVKILAPFGTFGALALSVMCFAMIYFGFRDADKDNKQWQLALLIAGLSFVWFGYLLSSPHITSIGYFIAFIGFLVMVIGYAIGMGGGGKDGGGGGGSSGSSDSSSSSGSDGSSSSDGGGSTDRGEGDSATEAAAGGTPKLTITVENCPGNSYKMPSTVQEYGGAAQPIVGKVVLSGGKIRAGGPGVPPSGTFGVVLVDSAKSPIAQAEIPKDGVKDNEFPFYLFPVKSKQGAPPELVNPGTYNIVSVVMVDGVNDPVYGELAVKLEKGPEPVPAVEPGASSKKKQPETKQKTAAEPGTSQSAQQTQTTSQPASEPAKETEPGTKPPEKKSEEETEPPIGPEPAPETESEEPVQQPPKKPKPAPKPQP